MTTSSQDVLSPGVIHRAIPCRDGAGVDIIDVDLGRSSARPAIVTGSIGQDSGIACTPQDWLTKTHALASINGGYFGQEEGDGRKEFIGLLVRRGKIAQGVVPLHGAGSAGLPKGLYVRSAFGLMPDRRPAIVWAATSRQKRGTPAAFDSPLVAGRTPHPWRVADAVGCGPTLIQHGKAVVTDRLERLASPEALPRTFVAYDTPRRRPRHFVMGIASAMTYQGLAAFLQDYFSRYDHTQAEAAMCLDGGASTQLSYRAGDGIQSPRATGVTVPDAVVILPR